MSENGQGSNTQSTSEGSDEASVNQTNDGTVSKGNIRQMRWSTYGRPWAHGYYLELYWNIRKIRELQGKMVPLRWGHSTTGPTVNTQNNYNRFWLVPMQASSISGPQHKTPEQESHCEGQQGEGRLHHHGSVEAGAVRALVWSTAVADILLE